MTLLRPAALSLLLAACAGVTSMRGPVGGFPAERPLPVQGTDLFDWKGVIHCHSYLSHDSDGLVADIAAAATVARLDFVVMTDHQTDASVRDGVRGQIGDTLFVVGAEIRTPQGTVLAFPLQQPLRRWMSAGALAQEAHEQGALAFIGHAEGCRDFGVEGFDGVEIVNLHAGAKSANPVGVVVTALFLPIRFLMERIALADPAVFANWDALLRRRHPCTPIGGNDVHANIPLLGPLGGTVNDYREMFLTLSTHVLAKSCDEGALVEALRLGRSFVSFDIVHEGSGFDFRAEDGARVWLPGDTVAARPALTLTVRTPKEGDIRLLRDGEVVLRRSGNRLELRNPLPGIYRVQVHSPFGKPWLFSSTIAVAAAP